MSKQKVTIRCLVGKKSLNEFWRKLDLGSTGVYFPEEMRATLKEGVKLNSRWKKKFTEALKDAAEKNDMEVIDISFFIPEKEF